MYNECILKERLAPEIRQQIKESGNGFSASYSTEDHIFTTKQVITETFLQNSKVVNLEIYFDPVNINSIL